MTLDEVLKLTKKNGLSPGSFIVTSDIHSLSGYFSYEHLTDLGQYRIPDIAYSLSNLNRYLSYGLLSESVAAHSLLCSEIARVLGYSTEIQFQALTHDFSEAYCNDLISPLKSSCYFYKRIEDVIQEYLGKKLQIKNLDKSVKECDSLCLAVEGWVLFNATKAEIEELYPFIKDTPKYTELWDTRNFYELSGTLLHLLSETPNDLSVLLLNEFNRLYRLTGRSL